MDPLDLLGAAEPPLGEGKVPGHAEDGGVLQLRRLFVEPPHRSGADRGVHAGEDVEHQLPAGVVAEGHFTEVAAGEAEGRRGVADPGEFPGDGEGSSAEIHCGHEGGSGSFPGGGGGRGPGIRGPVASGIVASGIEGGRGATRRGGFGEDSGRIEGAPRRDSGTMVPFATREPRAAGGPLRRRTVPAAARFAAPAGRSSREREPRRRTPEPRWPSRCREGDGSATGSSTGPVPRLRPWGPRRGRLRGFDGRRRQPIRIAAARRPDLS